MNWLFDNWQWWVPIFWLIGYELYALATHKRTLSQMVWASTKAYPWMEPIALSVVWVLVCHFWIPGVLGWILAFVGLGVIWTVYIVYWRGDQGLMFSKLFGLPKKEPVLVLTVAGLAVQLLAKYGIQVSSDDVMTVINVATAIAAAIWARSKVTPVAQPQQ